MSDICRLRFELRDGSVQLIEKTVKLRLYKDRYSAAAVLSGRAVWDGQVGDVLGITLAADGHTVHRGYAEYIVSEQKNGRTEVSFSSPGWSRLLAQNEPVPGLNYDVTLETLIQTNVRIPYVTCERGTQQVNYVYVKEHSTIWDAITAYSRKAYGTFPYIKGTNEVTVQVPAGAIRAYGPSDIIGFGTAVDRRTALSKAYMADIDDQYSYWAENPQAAADRLVRERYFPLDRQWLDDPDEGPAIRVDLSKRRYSVSYVRLAGYRREELFDNFSAFSSGRSLAGRIGGVEVIFEKGRAVTTLYVMD